MKQWYEGIPEIGAYNTKINITPGNVRLSNNLSPLTNFFLNVFINSFQNKNLIIAFPDIILKPIPLLSYLYCSIMNKDILVFTQTNPHQIQTDPLIAHNRNYHLLNYSSPNDTRHIPVSFEGEYLFYHTSLGILSDNEIKADVYLPRVNKRDLKNKYIKRQAKNVLDNSKPKITLTCEETKIYDFYEKVIIDNTVYGNVNTIIDPGLLIFENVDRFIYSDYSARLFYEWVSTQLSDKKILLHFSNPESRYISTIKQKTDSLVVPMLKSNLELKKASVSYFSKKRCFEEWNILNKYNLDKNSLYRDDLYIKVMEPHLEEGNINHYLQNSMDVTNKLDKNNLKNKNMLNILIKLLIELPNLVINPSKYKLLYCNDMGKWQYYTIPELIELFKHIVQEERLEIKNLLNELISEIFCLYLELKECKRYDENKTFSRIGKDYKIISLITELIKENESKIIVGTQSTFEKNIFKREIERLGIDNSLEIKTIDQLSKSAFERQNSILILAGPLRLRYLSQLLLPYKKILYICYEGRNYSLINEQIKLFFEYSYQSDRRSINYMNEIYKYLRVPKSDIFKGFKELNNIKIAHNEKDFNQNGLIKEYNDQDYLNNIRNILKINHNYPIYKEYEDGIGQIENSIQEIDKKSPENLNEISEIYYRISIRGVVDDKIIEKILPAEKTYLYLETDEGDILEGTPKVIKPDYFIIILDNDVRKSFLDLVVDVFGLEESVDKYLIEFWRDLLFKFIDDNELSYIEFYRLYKSCGGKREYQTVLGWAKGHALGPQDPKDLYYIGKILKNEDIIENFNMIDQEIKKLRELNRSTGRKLKLIIKEILKGKLDPDHLSFEEYMFYEKIKDGVFEVLKIERIAK